MKKITILLLLAFIAVNSVLAQSPNLFKYQAVLRDANGNIISNAPQTIIVNILQGSATGTSVYQETHNVTSTAQGILNLNIGGGTVNSGIFANINWGTNSYWVKLTIGTLVISNGQLFSVPYCLYSQTAGSSTSSQWANGASSSINYTAGNVGIGTATPNYLLHLTGTVPRTTLRLESNNTSYGPEVNLTSTATGGHEWRIVSGASASNSYGLGSFELWDQTAGASRFGIRANGNVGIGTTNPQNKLHVAGFIQLEGNPDAQILFGSTSTGKRGIGSLAGWDANMLYLNGWGDFTSGVSVGGNFASNLLVNGNVGIGTNTPAAKLHVAGTVRIADGTQGANKVLTSDASGNATWVTNTGITPAVTANLSSTAYNLTNAAGQYTGSYLTLPPGKWSVQINILLPSDASSLWVRSGFSSSSSSYISSGDVIGASLASGYKAANAFGMLIGTIIINNTSGSNKTYYYWSQNLVVYSGSLSLSNFGTSLWMEDQIIAYPMN